ncbi:MAG: amidohydrolase family protein [Bacillota bacterium]
MSTELQKVREIFEILHGRHQADLLIKNIVVLDVHGETTYKGSLLIHGGKIVALNPDETIAKARETFDGQGLFAIPGLIDAHFHFESQLVNPTALAEAIVPNGTTTIFAECLDLIGAAGEEGVEAARVLFKDYQRLPYRIFAFAPGKKVAAGITKELLDMEPFIGLGEFEHFSYSSGNEEDFQKAAWAREKGGFINSHWGVTTLSDMELNFLPAIGSTNNHDVWNAEDIAKSIRYGYATQIKFGVGSPEVIETLISAIIKHKFPEENFLLCTDNISMDRLLKQGHMGWIISYCAKMGMSPIKAIKMATLNTARYHRMDDKIGSLTPGRFADIVLTDSLSDINPLYVFKDGELIAKEKKLLKNTDIDYSAMRKKGIPGLEDLTADQLNVSPIEMSEDGTKAKVYLFDVYGRGHAKFYQEIWLPVRNGAIVPEYEGEKLARISVIRRYKKDGSRHIINGFFKGVYVNSGAVATAFPVPVPYLVVVGQESGEMCCCAKEVDRYSGACIVTENGLNKAVLPTEIYGMMADMTMNELHDKSAEVDAALETLGNRNQGDPVVNKLLSLFISLHRFHFMQE